MTSVSGRKILKTWTLTAFLVVMAVGILGCAITRNIVVLCAMIFKVANNI